MSAVRYRCQLCAGDAGPGHFRDPRSLGPESFGAIICSACRDRCKAYNAHEFQTLDGEGACPECHRYDAHEGICMCTNSETGPTFEELYDSVSDLQWSYIRPALITMLDAMEAIDAECNIVCDEDLANETLIQLMAECDALPEQTVEAAERAGRVAGERFYLDRNLQLRLAPADMSDEIRAALKARLVAGLAYESAMALHYPRHIIQTLGAASTRARDRLEALLGCAEHRAERSEGQP